MLPVFERLRCAWLVASHFVMVLIRDGEAISRARPLPPLVGERRIFLRLVCVAQIAVDPRERDVRGDKVRIELDRPQEERDRFSRVRPAYQRFSLIRQKTRLGCQCGDSAVVFGRPVHVAQRIVRVADSFQNL